MSTSQGKVVDYAVVSGLDLHSVGVIGSLVSKSSKRKCSAVNRLNNLRDECSLDLGLGLSSSSCTTICSEIGEESSIDLGFKINLNAGDSRLSNPKKVSSWTLNEVKARRPALDLQLTLFTETVESDSTSVTQGLIPHHNFSEFPVLTPTVHLVDEGSTSSRWINGPLVPPLKCPLDILIPYDQVCGNANPSPVAPNILPTVVPTPSLVGSASGLVNKRPCKTSVKTCRFKGCTKGARGSSGLCIAHGGGRRCQKVGCHKGAEGKTVFCKAHGGGRRCQHLGCTKSAEGRTDYCIGHGGGRRCSHEGCARAARGKSNLCIRHGGGKRCKMENCSKSAEGITGLCISHGGGRRCQYNQCTKGAQGGTMFCKAHGGGRRCTFLGCMKGAEGSTAFCKGHGGGKRCTSEGCTKSVHGGTLFCVSHGGGKRCALSECTKSARGRTNYCVRHGGGKRCKFERCPKSAQGSTNYCKAHGGGKRCSWVSQGNIPCDKFARGKSGLCAAHNAEVQVRDIRDDFASISATHGHEFNTSTLLNATYGATSICSIGHGHPVACAGQENFIVGKVCLGNLSLPEGRVHGGSLMAMLGGFEMTNTSQEDRGRLQP